MNANRIHLIPVLAGMLAASPVLALEGRYQGSAFGETLELVLQPGGRGSLDGDPLRWRQQGQRIVLEVDGEEDVGTLQGDRLVFSDMTFHRLGGSGGGRAGAAEPPARAPLMAKPLPGKRTTVGELGAVLTVPKGWSAGWVQAGGARAFRFSKRGVSAEEGSFTLTSTPIPPQERGTSIESALQQLGEQTRQQLVQAGLRSGQQVELELGEPETFEVKGRRAGRLLLRGRLGGSSIEHYLGLLDGGEWLYIASGNWLASRSKVFLPAADGTLASLEPRTPRENGALRQRLVGCWRQYEGDSSLNGSHNSETRYNLTPDGSYTMQSWMSVSVSGMGSTSRSGEQGQWRVVGQSVMFTPFDGEPYQVPVSFQGGILYANGRKFLPCG